MRRLRRTCSQLAPSIIQLKHNLHMSVFDWDRFSTDDKLGFAHLNLEPMMHAQEHTEDIELSEQGFVSLSLRWVPQQLVPLGKEATAATTKDLEAALPAAGPNQPQQSQNAGTGKVCVHLLRGEGLKAVDKNGKSDPLVKLSLGKKTFTSKTIMKTLEPRWNATFDFQTTQGVLASQPLKLSVFDWDPISSLGRNTSLGHASIDLSPLLISRNFWSSKQYYTVELAKNRPSTKTEDAREEATSLGRLHLSVSWDCDDDNQNMVPTLLRSVAAASARLLEAAAKCIVDPFGKDPMAIPTQHHGKVWAARQYYLTTYSGPRAGECSDHPAPLGWLDQMVEEGHLPRDLKVWRVEGGKAWVALGQEINQVVKAEQKAAKAGPSGEAGPSSAHAST